MKIIAIEDCSQCPHVSHSGAFTKGGAWPVCHGPGLEWEVFNEVLDYNDPEAGKKWSPPILPTNECRNRVREIPEWCPLPEGRLAE
jgi:hypothetical protein